MLYHSPSFLLGSNVTKVQLTMKITMDSMDVHLGGHATKLSSGDKVCDQHSGCSMWPSHSSSWTGAAGCLGRCRMNPRGPDHGATRVISWLAVLSGDKWEPYQIKIIMVLGLLLMLPTILPLFVFHDPKLSPVANGVNGASPESRQSTEARAKGLFFFSS